MKRLALTAFVLACSASAVQAAPIISPAGPGGYPAPGGTSFAAVGNAGNTGGAVRTYSGFDTSAWSELYFGFSGVTGPLGDNTFQNMTYSGYDGINNEFVWTAANPWTINTTSGPVVASVQFKQSFWNLANTVNINGAAGAVVGVPMPYALSMDAATLAGWGGGFTVRAAFTVNGSSTGVINYFDAQNQTTCFGPACVKTGTTGTFYYEPPTAVPEPASLFLLGSGLFGIGYNVRRRIGRARLA